MTKNLKHRAIILMLICSSLWSIAGIFIKLIPWNPLVIAGFRSLVASLVVVVYMKARKQKMIFNRDAFVSGIFLCATFLCFVTANKLTTAANAIILQFTAPIFILVLSAVFFKQKFIHADIIAVIATTCGIALFFFDQLSPGKLLGNIIGILSGLFMGLMFIFTGRTTDDNARMSGIFLGHLFTAVVGVPAAFFFPTPVSTTAVLSILALGIVQLGIPYVLYGIAVKNCPPLVCSLLGALEPLLNPVWVFLFTGEAPGAFAFVGGAVVIVSITCWCVYCDRLAAKSQV